MGITIMGYIGCILGLNWDTGKEHRNYYSISGLYRENGKHGNYYSILGLYRDNGREHGNYYNGLCRVYIGII